MSRKAFTEMVRIVPWARIGYPAGVLSVFMIILLSAFFSYRFFSVMMARVTIIPVSSGDAGVTFHLQEYRRVAPFFGLVESKATDIPFVDHAKLTVAITNAQLRNDRVISLQELLKNDSWLTTVVEENEIRSENITTIAAKVTQEKGVEAITALLIKNGFIVSRGKTLPKEEKFDILITLGAY